MAVISDSALSSESSSKRKSSTCCTFTFESNVSTSVVYPIVCGLIRKRLSANADDIPVVIRIKTVIADDLHKRFKPAEVATAATVPILSSCLGPRYKHLNFLSNEQRKLAIETLESTLEEL
jgi:hypothetical protein